MKTLKKLTITLFFMTLLTVGCTKNYYETTTPNSAPSIIKQPGTDPDNITMGPDGYPALYLSVKANSTPITYQWYWANNPTYSDRSNRVVDNSDLAEGTQTSIMTMTGGAQGGRWKIYCILKYDNVVISSDTIIVNKLR